MSTHYSTLLQAGSDASELILAGYIYKKTCQRYRFDDHGPKMNATGRSLAPHWSQHAFVEAVAFLV
jgi:hypothetical protein